MNTQSTRQSTGTLVALALCMALQMTGFLIILPLFALRLESFGAGVKALGLSATAYALTSTIAAPFIGMLADHFGRRPVILVSLAAYVGAFSGYLFATSAWLFILLRGLAGVFTAGLVPAIVSSVGDLAEKNRRAQWIGIVNGGASIGWILGPLLGGFLYDRFGYVVPFTVSIAMELCALLLAVLLIPETYIPSSHPSQFHLSWRPGFRSLPAIPAFTLIMLISFGVTFAWAFIEPQFMFYAYDDLAWTSSQLGLIISTWGLACTIGEFFLGQLSDRLGRKPVLVLGLSLFLAQFVGLVVFRDVIWIVVCFMLAGLGNAIFDPALSALILDLTPTEYIASMMGLKSTAGSLGNMLGPALVMLVTSFISPQMVFLISAFLVLLITFASTFALRVPRTNEVRSEFPNTAISR
jgi:DHA1 family tetracycline resistance protein-like MFS transporter